MENAQIRPHDCVMSQGSEWKQVHRCFAYHINKERDLIVMPGIHRTESGVSRSAGREKEETIPEAAIWTAE